MQSMMTDLDPGDRIKKRPWENRTCGSVILVAAGGDQIGKSENEEGPRRATNGGPTDEGNVVARDRWYNQRSRRVHASESGQQRERKWMEEVAGRTRPSRHQPRTKQDNPQGDDGADGWNMTSSDCVFR